MPPIENINDYQAVLRLNVADTNYFDLDNAKKLNDFIINNDFDEVITYCALGISRSPAIMICISKILKSPLMEKLIKENYKFYNKSIVNEFEKFPYQSKSFNDKHLSLRKKSYTKKKVKIPSITID